MINNNIKLALLFTLLFSNLSVLCMNGETNNFDLKELEDSLSRSFDGEQNKSSEWYQKLCEYIGNKNNKEVRRLLRIACCQALIFDQEITYSFEDKSDLLLDLAIKVESPKILKQLINTGQISYGKEIFEFVDLHKFENEKAKQKIIDLLNCGLTLKRKKPLTSLAIKYLELKNMEAELYVNPIQIAS